MSETSCLLDRRRRRRVSSETSLPSHRTFPLTSVYLKNEGSVARDHLANERTYLAWLRTSLSMVSVGIGVAQLFRLDSDEPNGKQIGVGFILISILFLAFACMRFFHAQTAMTEGYFPASRGIVVAASFILLLTLSYLFHVVLVQSL